MADKAEDKVPAAQAKASREAADKGAKITPEANENDPGTAKTLETADTTAAGTGSHRVSHDEEGPRGFDTVADGTVTIAPGATVAVTLTDEEEKRLKRFKIFKIEKAGDDA